MAQSGGQIGFYVLPLITPPSLGMFCKRDVSILALIIPVLKFMSFVPDANLFEYLVPQVLLQTLVPAKLKSVYCIFLPFCQKRL